MANCDHLDSSVISVLTGSLQERIEFAQHDRWIMYPRAKKIIGQLDDLLEYPRSIRMPSALIVGDAGNGKSSLIDYYCDRHPVRVQPSGDPIMPVVSVMMPSEPKESRFWTEILHALKIAHRPSDSKESKESQAIATLIYVGARMLIVDEVHNLLMGTAREQRQFLIVLKNLSNKLKIPIIGVGTRESITALHTDTQLSSRFEAIGLPRWKLDKDFLRLLMSFERFLPLAEPSNLTERELATRLHGLSEGNIGRLSNLLKRACKIALRAGQEKITSKTLEEVEWVKLSEYGKQAQVL